MKHDKRKSEASRDRYVRQPAHTPFTMNLMQLCYFAALVEGIRLIDEVARDRGVKRVKFNGPALVEFVQRKGVVIYGLQGGV